MCCSVLQCVAVCCSLLQFVAVCCSERYFVLSKPMVGKHGPRVREFSPPVALNIALLQCDVMWILQCAVVCCNVCNKLTTIVDGKSGFSDCNTENTSAKIHCSIVDSTHSAEIYICWSWYVCACVCKCVCNTLQHAALLIIMLHHALQHSTTRKMWRKIRLWRGVQCLHH